MNENDRRPPVGVAHVTLETDRMDSTGRFLRTIGMRPVFEGPEVAVYELRGGTHLVVLRKSAIVPGDAPFDLMVDDLHETHRSFAALGLSPTPIEALPAVDHETFQVTEPAGHVFTFYSSHVSGEPV